MPTIKTVVAVKAALRKQLEGSTQVLSVEAVIDNSGPCVCVWVKPGHLKAIRAALPKQQQGVNIVVKASPRV